MSASGGPGKGSGPSTTYYTASGTTTTTAPTTRAEKRKGEPMDGGSKRTAAVVPGSVHQNGDTVTHVTVSNTYPQQVITTTYPASQTPPTAYQGSGYTYAPSDGGATNSTYSKGGTAAASYAAGSTAGGAATGAPAYSTPYSNATFGPGTAGYENSEQYSNASKADKRAHHNALERKRRDHIKDSFSILRDSIPTLQGEKSSRAQILQKATEYIITMRSKNRDHQDEMERLKAENEELDAQTPKLVEGASE